MPSILLQLNHCFLLTFRSKYFQSISDIFRETSINMGAPFATVKGIGDKKLGKMQL